MTDKKDPGKTVIRPMPGGSFGGPPAPDGGGGSKTVIGGMPPAGGGGAPAAPQGGGWGSPGQGSGTTQWPGSSSGGTQWPGGGNQGGWPGGGNTGATQAPGWGGPSPGGQPQQPGSGGQWMGAKSQNEGFFPEIRKPQQDVRRAPVKKISLDAALGAKTSGFSSEANPITAAAASLLILFGRLRSQVVDMHAVPLMQHVTEEIEKFEERVLAEGVDQQDAMIAKYCLCGTADDIVQNLPGTDRAVWLQYSMSARFFNKRTAGVGFFQEVDKALQNPIHKYHLLELMLTCLQLGFEGQYRAMNGGDMQLATVKRNIYEALRRVRARGDDDISPRWKGVEIAARRAFARTPIWIIAVLASAVLAGVYFLMRFLLLNEGEELASDMRMIHPSAMIELIRPDGIVVVPPPPPPPEPEAVAQIERITEALEGEAVAVSRQGKFIVIDVNNAVLFAPGSTQVKDEFIDLASKISTVLNAERGAVRIIGHTDSDKLSGRGKYKNNFELSVARARAVADVLSPQFEEPERIEIDGRGEDEPVAANDSPANKAKNRRVEIMIQAEDTLKREDPQ